MKLKVLGGHGGLSQGHLTTSFLIDDKILIDAGSVASSLSIPDQAKINHILISHGHLDHIKDLAFMCDNCFTLRDRAFEVYTHKTVKEIIHRHLFNDIVWPDFTKIPSPDRPMIKINPILEETFFIEDYSITSVKVNHAQDALGFIIEKNDVALLFTLDTGPTDKIWEVSRGIKNLKGIFTEVSFPNNQAEVATVSHHHTPNSLMRELSKMPPNIPVIITHMKPYFKDEIISELDLLGNPRLQVLKVDGEVFNF